MNEGIHLDLDTWIVPGQIRKANLCRGLGNRYTPAGTEVQGEYLIKYLIIIIIGQPTLYSSSSSSLIIYYNYCKPWFDCRAYVTAPATMLPIPWLLLALLRMTFGRVPLCRPSRRALPSSPPTIPTNPNCTAIAGAEMRGGPREGALDALGPPNSNRCLTARLLRGRLIYFISVGHLLMSGSLCGCSCLDGLGLPISLPKGLPFYSCLC